jgi:hypothetical protein
MAIYRRRLVNTGRGRGHKDGVHAPEDNRIPFVIPDCWHGSGGQVACGVLLWLKWSGARLRGAGGRPGRRGRARRRRRS